MSSKVDVTGINQELFEGYLLKAASKAYSKVFGSSVNVSRIVSDGLKYYEAANEMQIGQFGSSEVHSVSAFSSNSPPSGLTISSVNSSLESLPIVDGKSLISLHFTPPQSEVLTGSETFDIESLDDADLCYDLKLKIAQTSKISISYDVQKVDEMQAA